MTSFRNRLAFSCLSIVGTAGLVSFSSPGSAASIDGVRRATVVVADLDLRKPSGQASFERRVAFAARTVCAEQNRFATAAEVACRRDAVAQARREAGLVDVAAN